MTDNGAGEKSTHRNGEEKPSSTAPVPSTSAAASPDPGNGACAGGSNGEQPAQLPIRDPKTGRILPGHSLNPRGKPPGIPNKNTEFVKLLNSRELRWVWNLAKTQAKKGRNELLEFLLERGLVKLTPEAAGVAVNISNSNNSFEYMITQLREARQTARPGMEDLEE